MKKKDIKESIGEVRSIMENLELLYSRLLTVEREGNLALSQSHVALGEAVATLDEELFVLLSLIRKD